MSKMIQLNNKLEMPMLGLGVFQTKDGTETENAVKWALEAGYRHIDTAMIYENEGSVGKAIAESGVPREEIFITTKLWNTDIRNHNTNRCADHASMGHPEKSGSNPQINPSRQNRIQYEDF